MYDILNFISDPAIIAAFIALTAMEIVLGIDNIVFISVIVSRLPEPMASKVRRLGIFLALLFRILLLFSITWVIGLKQPLFTLMEHTVTWKDMILIAGGLFLIFKAVLEIHHAFEGIEESQPKLKHPAKQAFFVIVWQIVMIDAVFSVDSILTAIGMTEHVEVMIAAVIVSMFVMYVASGPVAEFVHRYPTTKMLALAFLILIGVALIADGAGFHIDRGYIYFSMAFAASIEVINIMLAKRRQKRNK